VIRPATVADADAVSAVQRRAWAHAYADILDVEDLSPAIGEPARWREALAEEDMPTWVWDQDGRIAAFAAAGRSRDGDAGADVGEVYAIYVDPPAQGAGVGGALLAHAVGWLRDAGFRAAVLWTFEANGPARAFYERHGWRLVERDPQHADRWATEVRYRRDL
jgi:GNAT superfamily N-acetyltransferase